jgi:VanZ family protein
MKKLVFWTFLLALVTLSLMPTAYLAAPIFSIWDKAQHAFGFAVLTLLAVQAYPSHPRLRLAILLLLLGGAIELAQSASGWRTGDWRDGLANAVGIAVVLMLVRRRARFTSKAA